MESKQEQKKDVIVEESDNCTSVTVLMRHAERLDKTVIERFKSEWNKFDPPITEEGKKHAFFVGTCSVGYKL